MVATDWIVEERRGGREEWRGGESSAEKEQVGGRGRSEKGREGGNERRGCRRE